MIIRIERRELIAGLAVMAAYPRVVMAQVSGKRPLVGWLAGIAQPGTAVFVRAFLKVLLPRVPRPL
jgi:hypothetical protein